MIGDLPLTVIEKDEAIRLAPERFNDAGEVRSYCAAMVTAENQRSEWRGRIENVLNGAKPIPEAKLRDRKMAWYPNTNYRGLEGYIDTPRTSFYDLVTEVDPCIDVFLDYGKGREREQWQTTIAKHFSWAMLSKWRIGFNFHVQLCQREMLVHGVGAHVWPHMKSANWIPRTPKTGMILFPDGTPTDFEHEGEAFLLRDFVPIHELYGFVRNEHAARVRGWNPDMVWQVMAKASKKNDNTRGAELDQWIRKEKTGDRLGSMARTSGVWLHWLFVREVDTQKISLYCIADQVETKDYLFTKRNLYDEWPLSLFPYDIGNGDLHSIRGLGARAKDFFEMDNQLKNSMVAQVLLQNTIPMEQTGSMDPSKAKLTKMGVLSILPQGLKFAAGFKFPDLSQGPIALTRELQASLRANNDSYITGSPEAKDRETATSYVMRSQDSAQITKGTHGLYGSHLCLFYDKTFRMIVKAGKMSGNQPHITIAREFLRRCKRDGVPMEAFDHVEEIVEVMSTGAGSAAARIQALSMLMQSPVYGNTTDDRKTNLERDFVAATISGAKVDRYARNLTDNDTSDSDDSIITLENNDLTEGGNATVTDRQNHVRHAQRHLASAGAAFQAIQEEQMPPEQGLAALMMHGQHIAEHLARLEGNPTKQADLKALNKELAALGNAIKQLHQQVEEMHDSTKPTPEQQLSEQGQLGMMKVQQKGELDRAKFQAKAALDVDKLRFKQRLDDVKTATELRRQNALRSQAA